MSGPVSDRPAGRWPGGLLGMLALVVGVETSIVRARDDLVTPLAESWRVSARASERQATSCDVLALGDSLVKYGVLPKVIEAKAGLKAYNLATSGGTTRSAFFLLRRALDAGARPKAVVVDFEALMEGGEGSAPLRNYPDLATFRDGLEAMGLVGGPEFAAALMVAKVFPSCRLRFEIRASVLAALEGRSASQRESVVSHRKIWTRERGAQPTKPGRAYHPQEGSLIDRASPEEWSCSIESESDIDRFLDLADSRGIVVYWLLPPLAPEVHARRLARGSDATYGRFVRSVAARHPNAVVLDARGAGYDDSVHVDHLHLDRRGASVLSDDLAGLLLAGPLLASSWVDLPSFAGRSGDGPLPAPDGLRTSTARRSQGVPR